MIGITEINKEISEKNKLSEAEVKRVTASFLEVIKQKLISGEDVSFKNYFTLKRSKQVPKVSKLCDNHTKKMDEYKRNNKGKGLASFAKSPFIRKLNSETRSCNSCKTQKQKIAKSTKLLTRIVSK